MKNFISIALFLFIAFDISANNKFVKPDLVIVKLTNFQNNVGNKKIYFDIEVRNASSVPAFLSAAGISIQTFLSQTAGNNTSNPAGGLVMPGSAGATIPAGQSKVFKNVWYSYGNDPWDKFAYMIVHIDHNNSVAESDETNNKRIARIGPDLSLEVSGVTHSIETNSQTGVVFKEYKFTCTVKNVSEWTAVLDENHKLTIQSYRVSTCTGASVGGAGGRLVGQNLTQILPGETVVFENQSANQPPKATTKIRVELLYAIDSNLANNKSCIEN